MFAFEYFSLLRLKDFFISLVMSVCPAISTYQKLRLKRSEILPAKLGTLHLDTWSIISFIQKPWRCESRRHTRHWKETITCSAFLTSRAYLPAERLPSQGSCLAGDLCKHVEATHAETPKINSSQMTFNQSEPVHNLQLTPTNVQIAEGTLAYIQFLLLLLVALMLVRSNSHDQTGTVWQDWPRTWETNVILKTSDDWISCYSITCVYQQPH